MTVRVGGYELLEEIGRGGAGRVHRARAPDGREVAVKLLTARSPGAGARFLREQRLQGAFGAGEGFVPLLDAGDDEQGRPYLVLPLLEGGTLRQRLSRGALPAPEARALGVALARALGAAHARGIVHRDVKPSNVLFDGAGRPFVSDLGLARQFTSGAPDRQGSVGSRTGDFRGTPGYMAPEQLLDAKRVGPPADVFGLGAVLYEVLAGRPPFGAPSLIDVALKIERGDFTPLRALRPELPADLCQAIERALHPDPAERWPDGQALAAALEAPAPVAPPPLPRWLLPALLGALVLVGGAIVLVLAQGRGAQGSADGDGGDPGAASVEPAPVVSAGAPSDVTPLSPELTAALAAEGVPPAQVYGRYEGLFATSAREAVALAGGELALRLREEGPVRVVGLDGRVRLQLEHPGAQTLAASPDGRRLASGGQGEVRVWDPSDGHQVAALTPAQPEVIALALAEDGRVLVGSVPTSRRYHAARAWDLELELFDARGQRRAQLAGLPDDDLLLLEFLPGGRVLALGEGGAAAVWQADSGQLVRSFETRVGSAGDAEEGLPVTAALVRGTDRLLVAYRPGEGLLRWWDAARGEMVGSEGAPVDFWPTMLVVGGSAERPRIGMVYADGAVVVRSPEGAWRAAGSAEGLLPRLAMVGAELVAVGRRVVVLDPPRPAPPVAAHVHPVCGLALTRDGQVVSVDEQTLIEWDPAGTPRWREELRPGGTGSPESVRFAGSAGEALLVAQGTRVSRWSRGADGWTARELPARGEEVNALVSDRAGQVILEQLQDGFRRLDPDRPPGAPIGQIPGEYVQALALVPDGRLAVVERGPSAQEVWDLTQGVKQRELSLRPNLSHAHSAASDPARLACGDEDGSVTIFALETGLPISVLPPTGSGVQAQAFSPDGRELAVASEAGRLDLWRPGEPRPRWTLDLGPCADGVTALGWSADGRELLAGTRRGVILRLQVRP